MASPNDTARSLRIVESDELAATLVIARPRRPGQVVVITSPDLTALQVMMISNVLLSADERNQLADWLEVHRGAAGPPDDDDGGPPFLTRPHDWPHDS